ESGHKPLSSSFPEEAVHFAEGDSARIENEPEKHFFLSNSNENYEPCYSLAPSAPFTYRFSTINSVSRFSCEESIANSCTPVEPGVDPAVSSLSSALSCVPPNVPSSKTPPSSGAATPILSSMPYVNSSELDTLLGHVKTGEGVASVGPPCSSRSNESPDVLDIGDSGSVTNGSANSLGCSGDASEVDYSVGGGETGGLGNHSGTDKHLIQHHNHLHQRQFQHLQLQPQKLEQSVNGVYTRQDFARYTFIRLHISV
ncbi:unnamed protein product, partial [Protopolystoma xenopodis]